jgi:hypothetical protein
MNIVLVVEGIRTDTLLWAVQDNRATFLGSFARREKGTMCDKLLQILKEEENGSPAGETAIGS